MRQAAWLLLWCSSFIVGAALDAGACTYSSVPTKMGQNFTVNVAYRDKPLAGIHVTLSTDPKGDEESRTVAKFATDDRGQVRFASVKPGRYWVEIDRAAFPQSLEIEVDGRATRAESEKINFEWPNVQPVVVRSVSGLLNVALRTGNPLKDQTDPTFGPFAGASLDLSKAVSGDVIETQTTSESGAFGFQPLPAGLYMLRVGMEKNPDNRYYAVDGYVPLEVDPDAKDMGLNLFLFGGICGSLGFENR